MSKSADNYNLKSLKVNGAEIDVGNVEVINIYEGLTNPALTGTIALKDREALLEFKEVFAGDTIELQFDTETKNAAPFNFKGIITSADGGEISLEHTFPLTVLHFCTPWWFKAVTKQVSKSYKNQTVTEILKDLIEVECGGEFRGVKPALSKKIERLVLPNWTVAHSIKYIMNWLSKTPEETGYTMFDNLSEQFVTVMSLDWLFDGAWFKHTSDLVFGSENITYEGNVEQIFLESYYDSMRYVNHGVYQTDAIIFDYDRNKFIIEKQNVDDLDLFHLAPTMPLLKKHTEEEFKSTMLMGLPFGQQKRRKEKEVKDIIAGTRNNKYCNLYTDMLKFNLVIPGNTNRSAGMIVKFDFPSIKSQSDPKTRHKYLEGHYLIRNINHIFRNDVYNQAITLCRDGFGTLDRTDMVQWNKVSTFEENNE